MRTILTAAAALTLALAAGCTQQPAAPRTAQATSRSGVNVGSLSCNVAGSVGLNAVAGVAALSLRKVA